MSRKIYWLTFWTTMTFWLGMFWGCAATGDDQNYKKLDEPADRGESEPFSMRRSRALNVSRLVLPAVALAQMDDAVSVPAEDPNAGVVEPTVEVVPPTVTQEASDPQPVVEVIEPAQHVESTAIPATRTVKIAIVGDGVPKSDEQLHVQTIELPEPSIHGIDRSHWTTTQVGPADGTTRHCPVLFSDCPIYHNYGDVKSRTADEARLEAALNGRRAGMYDLVNSAAAVTQPFKFAFDFVAAPVFVFIGPRSTP